MTTDVDGETGNASRDGGESRGGYASGLFRSCLYASIRALKLKHPRLDDGGGLPMSNDRLASQAFGCIMETFGCEPSDDDCFSMAICLMCVRRHLPKSIAKRMVKRLVGGDAHLRELLASRMREAFIEHPDESATGIVMHHDAIHVPITSKASMLIGLMLSDAIRNQLHAPSLNAGEVARCMMAAKEHADIVRNRQTGVMSARTMGTLLAIGRAGLGIGDITPVDDRIVRTMMGSGTGLMLLKPWYSHDDIMHANDIAGWLNPHADADAGDGDAPIELRGVLDVVLAVMATCSDDGDEASRGRFRSRWARLADACGHDRIAALPDMDDYNAYRDAVDGVSDAGNCFEFARRVMKADADVDVVAYARMNVLVNRVLDALDRHGFMDDARMNGKARRTEFLHAVCADVIDGYPIEFAAEHALSACFDR